MIRPPIVGAETWRLVMSAADYRCQCAGACGSGHTPAGQRTPGVEHRCAKVAAPGAGPLVAAPADPTVAAVVAAALLAEDLRAWCPRCYAAALAVARRAVKTEPEPTADLFDPAPYRRPARQAGQYRRR
jgi:hypothetical protein